MSLFKKNLYLCILIQILSLVITSVEAKVYSKLELQQMAIDYITEKTVLDTLEHSISELSVTALPLDSRIETRTCLSALQLSAANPIQGNRQSTIKIKCLDEKNWQVFVHTKQVQLVEVITASQGISKGQRITEQHLTKKKVAKHLSRSNQFKVIDPLLGSRSKRNVRAGQAINYNYICNVCKGDKVTILASFKGMKVKTQGEALQDGRIGDNIRVKNVKSGKKIQARVTGTQQVQVTL